jgi:hypothetical protein
MQSDRSKMMLSAVHFQTGRLLPEALQAKTNKKVPNKTPKLKHATI